MNKGLYYIVLFLNVGVAPPPPLVLFSPDSNKIARSFMFKSYLRILFSAFHALPFLFLVRSDKVFDHVASPLQYPSGTSK